MNAPVKTKAPTQAEDEFAKALAIAREALSYVGTFRTPPTPEVFELWYRYAEGGNPALSEQLSFAINEAKAVSGERLHQLQEQFVGTSDAVATNQRISQDLSRQMGTLELAIRSQLTANSEFGSSVQSVNRRLQGETVTVPELQTCVANAMSSNEKIVQQLNRTGKQLEDSQRQVQQLRHELVESQQRSLTDPLTSIGNRRFFDGMLIDALQQPYRPDAMQFLLLLDLDKFKSINDTFGHEAGDDVLQFIGSVLKQLAAGCSIARYGGDEFAIAFTAKSARQASDLAEKICEYFGEKTLTIKRTGEPLGKVTLSIGVALRRADDDRYTWFERADKLLYSAKANGRNCFMLERNLTR